MSIFYQGATNFDSGVAAHTGILTWPASPTSQLALAILGVEGATAGSGPWIDPNATHPPYDNNGTGWYRVLFQAPSATGNGLEVWASVHGGGTTQFAFLAGATLTYAIQGLLYGGTYVAAPNTDPSTNGMISASASAQVTGDNPAAPSVFAFQNELVVACAADQLQAPGYGTPTPAGWTQRIDNTRGGGHGNVEITGADTTVGVTGTTGTIPWAATAATGTTKGSTATLALRPASQPPAATTPVMRFSYPLSP